MSWFAALEGPSLITALRGLPVTLLAAGCVATGGSLPLLAPTLSAPEEGHSEEHGKGTQALNLFAGGSGEVGDNDGFTLGADYEYRLSSDWGVGGFAEGVSGLDRSFALGAQGYWHSIYDLVLVAGPGVERHNDEWRGLVRLGAFYEFPVGGGWVLSPALFYDFTEGEGLLIYGLNVGYLW